MHSIKTIWVEARQVTTLLEWPPEEGDQASPDIFLRRLLERDRKIDAIRFLAQAIDRLAAIWWLRQVIARQASSANLPTLSAIDEWLDYPSDTSRRRAFDAASKAPGDDPARLCATAIYFSGGSLAPEGAPIALASKHITGRLVGAGLLLCNARSTDADGARTEALDIGFALVAQP